MPTARPRNARIARSQRAVRVYQLPGAIVPSRRLPSAGIPPATPVEPWPAPPTISVDTKKKELVGDFKNAGHELRPKGQPKPVRVRDSVLPKLGRVATYGVFDTANFAIESLRRWWVELGHPRYSDAKWLLITADCGGSNGARVRLLKTKL